MIGVLVGVPLYLAWKIGGGTKTTLFFALFTTVPLLAGYWIIVSSISPRKNEKARHPSRPIEHYLTFKKPGDKAKYHGKIKIPMETFHELYFDGDVDFNGDCLEVMEYRHDWANFRLTINVLKYFLLGMVPEVIMHSRSQGMVHQPLLNSCPLVARTLIVTARRGTSTRSLRPWGRFLRLVPRSSYDLHVRHH